MVIFSCGRVRHSRGTTSFPQDMTTASKWSIYANIILYLNMSGFSSRARDVFYTVISTSFKIVVKRNLNFFCVKGSFVVVFTS